ncbi:MAG: hypothetical protein ACRCS0_14975 [Albidovulum sp.]
MTGKRMALGALVLVAAVGGCTRNKFPVTACVGDEPAIERTKDVAPPNCPDT